METEDNPIFILASGQRCGSTLLQRLLNSHPEILIWGEQHGFLNGYLREHKCILDWEEEYRDHRETYLKYGYDNFVANMLPSSEEIVEASRSFVRKLFGSPAESLGKKRWGFKEVRYDTNIARFLLRLFPKANIIHLTRNVIDCFISLKHWENAPGPWTRSWTEIFLNDWKRINASFLSAQGSIPRCISVRYEDLTSIREDTLDKICSFLGISASSIDHRVFEKRLFNAGERGLKPRPLITRNSLSTEERELVTRAPIPDLSKALNYDLDFD